MEKDSREEEYDLEYRQLIQQRRAIDTKMAKYKEIHRLQHELQRTSFSSQDSEYQTENDDSLWYASSYNEEETDSTYLYKREQTPKWRRHIASSNGKGSKQSESSDTTCRPREMTKPQSRVELPKDSPLFVAIELVIIDQHLKIPSLNQFDG